MSEHTVPACAHPFNRPPPNHRTKDGKKSYCKTSKKSELYWAKRNLGFQGYFWSRIHKTDGCWLWTGPLTRAGYGIRVHRDGKPQHPHTIAYELVCGRVPDGLQLDHLCKNRACVNPDHLEPVTQIENVLRGDSPPAQNRRKECCKRGHSLSGKNLVIERDGHRRCRKCKYNNQIKREALRGRLIEAQEGAEGE